MAIYVRGQTVDSSSSKITYEFPCRETAKCVPSILINVDQFVQTVGMGKATSLYKVNRDSTGMSGITVTKWILFR